MADLTDAQPLVLRTQRFPGARPDLPVGGAPPLDAVMTALASIVDMDYSAVPAVIGILKAKALGIPQPATSSGTLAKYRRLATKSNLSAADMGSVAGPAFVRDFATGAVRTA